MRKRPRPSAKRPATSPNASAASSAQTSSVWATLVCLLIIAGVTVAVFAPTTHYKLLTWDDDQNLLDNPDIRGFAADNLWAMLTSHRLGVWQPLSWLAAAVQYAVFDGANADSLSRGLHATNIGLHIVAAWLCFVLLRRLMVLGARREAARSPLGLNVGATIATLLFAVHPLRVEVVAWATAQPYILATIFALASTWCYLRAQEGGGVRWHVAAAVGLALALLCKATAIPLIAVWLVLDVIPLRRVGGTAGWHVPAVRRVLLEKVPYAVLALGAVVLAIWATHAHQPASVSTAPPAGIIAKLMLAAYGIMFCLATLVAPLNLAPLYVRPIPFDPTDVWYLTAAVAFVVLSVAAFALRRRAPWLAVAWLVHVLILLPVSGLVAHGGQVVADRYTYLASIGWLALFGVGVLQLWTTSRPRSARIAVVCGAIVAVASLGTLTRRYLPVWHDSVSVWSAMTAHYPRYALGQYNLARAYRVAGDREAAQRCLRTVLELDPQHAQANMDLGTMLHNAGDDTAAIECFEAALRSRPDYALAHFNLARILAGRRQFTDALSHMEAARRSAAEAHDERLLAAIDRELPRLRAAAERARSPQPAP